MFTKDELMQIEVGLYMRKQLLKDSLGIIPETAEKLEQVNQLIVKVIELGKEMKSGSHQY